MGYAKVLKKAVVRALKGRSKQELACEDVEAQAESGKMGSEVQLQLKGIGEGSDLQKVHYRQCGRGLQRQKDRWKRVTSKSKNSSLGKDGRSLREYGTRGKQI